CMLKRPFPEDCSEDSSTSHDTTHALAAQRSGGAARRHDARKAEQHLRHVRLNRLWRGTALNEPEPLVCLGETPASSLSPCASKWNCATHAFHRHWRRAECSNR